MIQTLEQAEIAKLNALRDAAQVGITALERGEFKEFADTDAFILYLNKLADHILPQAE